MERPLLALGQPFGYMMRIAQEELRRIHQHGAVGALRIDREPGHHRDRERFLDRGPFRILARRAAKVKVRLHQQKLRPGPVKVDDQPRRNLSTVHAVSAQLAAPHAPGRLVSPDQVLRARVRSVAVERHFQIQLACLRIPVQRQQAGHVLHRLRLFGD